MKDCGPIPTILIVEDIEWIRSGMRKALERHGFRVAEAEDDAEAFEFAKLQRVDLICTEEEVSTFNELMARLHQHPTSSSVPVAIINPDVEDGARLGDAYLLADYADIASFLSVEQR